MHELSIIHSIVDLAATEVERAGARSVEKIELQIGELAGVEWQALDFAWEVGVQKSVLEHAVRDVDRVPGQARCLECHHEFVMNQLYDACPACGSYFSEVLQGKELRVVALTLI